LQVITLRLRRAAFQTGFLGFQQIVDLFDELMQLLRVLFSCGLFAEYFPAFFVLTKHGFTPAGYVTRLARLRLPKGPDCFSSLLLVRCRTCGAPAFGCHSQKEVADCQHGF
jgi:hypothetical protein